METRAFISKLIFSDSTRGQFTRFLGVGGTTVLLDWLTYFMLVEYGTSVNLAKAIGFIVGAIFAFFANSRLTFKNQKYNLQTIVRFSSVYIATLILNVLINFLALGILSPARFAPGIAFVIATTVSAIANFLGMKYFSFRQA